MRIDDFDFHQSSIAKILQHQDERLMLTSNAALTKRFFLTNCESNSCRSLAQSLLSRDVDEMIAEVPLQYPYATTERTGILSQLFSTIVFISGNLLRP